MSKKSLEKVFEHLDEELVWRLKNVFDEMWECETLYHEVDELGYSLDKVWSKWDSPWVKKVCEILVEWDSTKNK